VKRLDVLAAVAVGAAALPSCSSAESAFGSCPELPAAVAEAHLLVLNVGLVPAVRDAAAAGAPPPELYDLYVAAQGTATPVPPDPAVLRLGPQMVAWVEQHDAFGFDIRDGSGTTVIPLGATVHEVNEVTGSCDGLSASVTVEIDAENAYLVLLDGVLDPAQPEPVHPRNTATVSLRLQRGSRADPWTLVSFDTEQVV